MAPVVPGYVLGRPIHRGHKATVYAAADAEFGTPVAVKVLTAADPKTLRLFRRELRAGVTVRHANLVRVRGGNAFAPPYYLVMDYLPGESLRDRLDRDGRLDPAEAVSVARQVAAGLAALHAAGLVHADVKPENVRLTEQGRVKLVDLGFAHRPGEDAGLHAAGSVMGTPNYLAPELCARPPVDGYAADLFALGVTLFESLAGVLPYPNGSAAEVVRRHRLDPPAELRQHGRFPSGVVLVVKALLAADPGVRLSARAAAADLAAFRTGLLRRAG
jgi:serine/threonine protein kinase